MRLTFSIEPSDVGGVLTLAAFRKGLDFLRLGNYDEDIVLYASTDDNGDVTSLNLVVSV